MKPVLCVNPGIGSARMSRQFPGVVCLDWDEVMVHRLPPEWDHCSKGPFDRYCEEVWVRDAQLIMDQYQRWDMSGDLGWLDRTQHFYKQLVLWNTLISELKPDLMIFMWPPHVQHDIVLLALAKARGIRHVIPNYAWKQNSWIAQPSMDFGQFRAVALRFAKWEQEAGLQLTEENLAPPLRRRLREVRSSDTAKALPDYARDLWKTQSLPARWLKCLRYAAASIGRAFVQDMRSIAAGRHREPLRLSGKFKERGRSLEKSFTGAFSATRFAIGRMIDRRKLAKTKASSEFWSRPADEPSRPYVYAPLHYQPEMTTNPLGGIYCAQFLMLNILAHSLPDGWELWVKDHPAQFVDYEHLPFMLHHNSRNDDYYRMIAELPNTRLLSSTLTPFNLIDGSRAVAAVTGTAGWEAIIRGRPALVFGEVWYDGAPNVFRVKTLEEARDALRRISEGAIEEKANVVPILKEMDLHQFDLAGQFERPFPDLRMHHEAEILTREIARHAGCYDPKKPLVLSEILGDEPALPMSQTSENPTLLPTSVQAGNALSPATIDWNAELQSLPATLSLADLPPLVRELVLRNKLLRERIARLEGKLWEMNPDENQEPPVAIRELRSQAQRALELEHQAEQLVEVTLQLKTAQAKIEDLRGMKARRDERIKKLEKKLGIADRNSDAKEPKD